MFFARVRAGFDPEVRHDKDHLVTLSTCVIGNRQKIRGKTALVAGATGGVGSQVVQCLVNEGVKVRALVRDYTKAVRL